jgi:molecular chaperone DnaK (HSP70)
VKACTTPSIVAFTENGERHVGDPAKATITIQKDYLLYQAF